MLPVSATVRRQRATILAERMNEAGFMIVGNDVYLIEHFALGNEQGTRFVKQFADAKLCREYLTDLTWQAEQVVAVYVKVAEGIRRIEAE